MEFPQQPVRSVPHEFIRQSITRCSQPAWRHGRVRTAAARRYGAKRQSHELARRSILGGQRDRDRPLHGRGQPCPRGAGSAGRPPALGGGPGKVWVNGSRVNGSTRVYHCMDDRYYGRTKSGSYMTEAEAKAKGLRPAHGKGCGG